MKKTFVRIIGDDEINIDAQQDFIDDKGNRHPRNVLWLWSDDDLWDVLHIRVDWVDDTPKVELDPIQIPREPDPPAPVRVMDEVLPLPEPAAPAAPAPPPMAGTDLNTRIIPLLTDAGVAVTDDMMKKLKAMVHTDAEISVLMAYGGIAIRTLRIAKQGGYHQGHKHNYDHITNVIRGSVLCEMDGAPPRKFVAPAQITIEADKWHKFTALEDDVVYQCVYRQPDRIDLYTEDNSPYGMTPFTSEELLAKLQSMDNPCAHCDCDDEGDDVQPQADKL